MSGDAQEAEDWHDILTRYADALARDARDGRWVRASITADFLASRLTAWAREVARPRAAEAEVVHLADYIAKKAAAQIPED